MKTLFTIVTIFVFTLSFAQSYTDGCLDSLEVQSEFSPNGDGINDVISIDFDCLPDEFQINFFNRWGSVIFESDDSNFSWDGTVDGQPQPSGVYFWTMIYRFNSEEVNTKGNLTIIR